MVEWTTSLVRGIARLFPETLLQAGQCIGEAAAGRAVVYSLTACVSQDFHRLICTRTPESVGDSRCSQLVNCDTRLPQGTNTLETALPGKTAEITQYDMFTPKTSLTHCCKYWGRATGRVLQSIKECIGKTLVTLLMNFQTCPSSFWDFLSL